MSINPVTSDFLVLCVARSSAAMVLTMWHTCIPAFHENPTNMPSHYNGVIMSAMASQITSLNVVYSTVYSGEDQRRHQSSASLAFVRGIHRWPVNSPHQGPVTRKMFPLDDVIMWVLKMIKIVVRFWAFLITFWAIMVSNLWNFAYILFELALHCLVLGLVCKLWWSSHLPWRRHWPFARGIHRSPVNSPHKGQRSFDVFLDLQLNKQLSK